MTVWLDAQLPPAVGPWMAKRFGVRAFAVRDLGLRDADDSAIFQAARRAGAVVITKDRDFVALVQRLGKPPQIVWLRSGNTTNARLRQILDAEWQGAVSRLAAGDDVVEMGAE